jgi:hypothetical protein
VEWERESELVFRLLVIKGKELHFVVLSLSNLAVGAVGIVPNQILLQNRIEGKKNIVYKDSKRNSQLIKYISTSNGL